MKNDELRSIATRVKELRQELESVEARLRELTGGSDSDPRIAKRRVLPSEAREEPGDGAPLAPIESIDSPTVLTTNHALRRAESERRLPLFAALGSVVVLTGGIGIGYALRSEPPAPPQAITVATAPPAPPPAILAPPVVVVEPTAPAPSATITASATVTVMAPPTASITAVRPAALPAPTGKLDRGF